MSNHRQPSPCICFQGTRVPSNNSTIPWSLISLYLSKVFMLNNNVKMCSLSANHILLNDSADLFSLDCKEIHIWIVQLDQMLSRIPDFIQTLHPDEIHKAEHFRFKKDRDDYIVARGSLRRILSSYLRMEPSKLCFQYNAYGKPSLSDKFPVDAIHFNVSHSHKIAVFAVARNSNLGIDIEYIRNGMDWETIAEQYFSIPELKRLQSQVPAKRAETFYEIWTCREAYVKAKGLGLSFLELRVEGTINPTVSKVVLDLLEKGKSQEDSNWVLHRFQIGPDYLGAVAVESPIFTSLACDVENRIAQAD